MSTKNTIDCPCGFGKNLPVDTTQCPKCGLDLKPLSDAGKLQYEISRKSKKQRSLIYILAVVALLFCIALVISLVNKKKVVPGKVDMNALFVNFKNDIKSIPELNHLDIFLDSTIHLSGDLDVSASNKLWKLVTSTELPANKLNTDRLAVREHDADSFCINYTVRRGESLSILAGSFYGDPYKWSSIYKANKMLIPNPDKLKVGIRLKIPVENTIAYE